VPPKFSELYFDFPEGQSVPEHVDGWPFDSHPPGKDELDPTKYHLKERDGFSGADFAVAIDIDTLDEAKFLADARKRFKVRNGMGGPSGRTRIASSEYISDLEPWYRDGQVWS